MGITLSRQLRRINGFINQTREVINEKYDILDIHNLHNLITPVIPEAIDKLKTYDLDDGNAQPEEVRLGKICYIKDGVRIEGTLDLTQANIEPSDVIEGQTIYAKDGVLIMGTLPVIKEDQLIALSKELRECTLAYGYYKGFIRTTIDDYDIVYTANYPGSDAIIRTEKHGESIQLLSSVPDVYEDLLGWSRYPTLREPEFPPGATISEEELRQPFFTDRLNPQTPNTADTVILYGIFEFGEIDDIDLKIRYEHPHPNEANAGSIPNGSSYETVYVTVTGGNCNKDTILITKGLACSDPHCIYKEKTGDNSWTLHFNSIGKYPLKVRSIAPKKPKIDGKYATGIAVIYPLPVKLEAEGQGQFTISANNDAGHYASGWIPGPSTKEYGSIINGYNFSIQINGHDSTVDSINKDFMYVFGKDANGNVYLLGDRFGSNNIFQLNGITPEALDSMLFQNNEAKMFGATGLKAGNLSSILNTLKASSIAKLNLVQVKFCASAYGNGHTGCVNPANGKATIKYSLDFVPNEVDLSNIYQGTPVSDDTTANYDTDIK